MPSISRYDIDKKVEIFQKDSEFQNTVVKKAGINITEQKYRELSEYLLLNQSFISEFTIQQIITDLPLERQGKQPFQFEFNPIDFEEEEITVNEFREKIAEILNLDFLPSKVYRQILYSFKYSTLKTFFRDNWRNFVPDFDIVNITRSDQLKIFQESFMREFDRLSEVIDEIYNIQDIDRTPREYLNYLAQAIGYEREDEDFLFDASFRELIKNIIEVYRIKGTNFSFELFFNFLGFEAEVREFWFDKRFFDPNIISNPYTGVSDRTSFGFYLTTERPTDYIPSGMRDAYSVSDDDIKPTLDGNMFTYLAESGFYTPEQLLGEEPGYPDETYTFFKTNVMEFSLERLSSARMQERQQEQVEEEEEEEDEDEIVEQGLEEGGLSGDDLEIIRLYANFLTPIFVQRQIVVVTRPFRDDLSILKLSDANRPDPRAFHPTINNESMFHLYQGAMPKRYYWEDGKRHWRYQEPFYTPTFEENKGPRWDGVYDLEPGGHFISGFHKDTTQKIYNKSRLNSVYSLIEQENPNYGQYEIYSKIKDLLSTKETTITGDLLKNSNEIINISGDLSSIEKNFDLYSVNDKKTFTVHAQGTQGDDFIFLENTAGLNFSKYRLEEIFGVMEDTEILHINFANGMVNISNELIDDLDQEITIVGYRKEKAKILEIDKENNKIVIDKNSFDDYLQKEFSIVGNLFIKYGITDRDLFSPFVDESFAYPEARVNPTSFFGIGTPPIFYTTSKPKIFWNNWEKYSYFQGPDQSRFNKTKVLKIKKDEENDVTEIYLNDARMLFDKFKKSNGADIERRLNGDFVKGDKKITNVEYNFQTAPVWEPKEYKKGDLVRDPNDLNKVYECIESYNGQDDNNPDLNFFKVVRGVRELKIGYKIKKPGFVFNNEIVDIDVFSKTVTLRYPSYVTTTNEPLIFFSRYRNWIYLEKTVNMRNDGIYNVIDSKRDELNGREVTKITVDGTSLVKDQDEEGGLLGIYKPRRRMDDRIDFMYNELKTKITQKGFTNYSYEDDIKNIILKVFDFERKNYNLNMKAPYPNDWPINGKYEPIKILGKDYASVFDRLEDYKEDMNFLRSLLVGKEDLKKYFGDDESWLATYLFNIFYVIYTLEEMHKLKFQKGYEYDISFSKEEFYELEEKLRFLQRDEGFDESLNIRQNTFYNKAKQKFQKSGMFEIENEKDYHKTIRTNFKHFDSYKELHPFYMDYIDIEFYRRLTRLLKNIIDDEIWFRLKDKDLEFEDLEWFERLKNIKERINTFENIIYTKEKLGEITERNKEEELEKFFDNDIFHSSKYNTRGKNIFYNTALRQNPMSKVEITEDNYLKMFFKHHYSSSSPQQPYYYDYLEMKLYS